MNKQNQENRLFDLVRLSQSKKAVDLAPNTIRAYGRDGLKIYRMGKAAFFSRTELEEFIRKTATVNTVNPKWQHRLQVKEDEENSQIETLTSFE